MLDFCSSRVGRKAKAERVEYITPTGTRKQQSHGRPINPDDDVFVLLVGFDFQSASQQSQECLFRH